MKWPTLKQLFSLSLLGAAVVMTVFSIWLVLIVWKGGWDAGLQSQQLEILGWALLCGLGGVGMSVGAIAIGGPLRSLKGGAGPVTVEVEGDDV